MIRRRLWSYAMYGACAAAVLVALFPLVSVMAMVIGRGIGGLSWHFLTSTPAPVGEPGGVGNALLGTLEIVGLASVIALPVGIFAGSYLAERGDSPFGQAVRFLSEVLGGVPSIVTGVVVYGLIVVPMHRFSAIAGAVALAFLMIPVLARASEEMIRLVPSTLREASLALGVAEWRTRLRVVLPTALSGLATAALLVIARASGETAPLLFTSLNNQAYNLRPDQPTAALTVQIFTDAISPYDEWHQHAWTAALLLLLVVATLNLSARALAKARTVR